MSLFDQYDLSETERKLLEKNIFYLTGPINMEKYDSLLDIMAYFTSKGSPGIEMRIKCNGGEAHAGLDIYDLVRFYEGKTTGIVMCRADSMAAIVLQACDYRIALPHAQVLIHSIAIGQHVGIDVNLDGMNAAEKRWAKGVIAQQEKIVDIICERTGQNRIRVKNILRKDKAMTPKKAKKFGLIDEIWSPMS